MDNTQFNDYDYGASEVRVCGTVKVFDGEKGWGFIAPDDGTIGDMFVHKKQIDAGWGNESWLNVGEYVECGKEWDAERNRWNAKDVRGGGGMMLQCVMYPTPRQKGGKGKGFGGGKGKGGFGGGKGKGGFGGGKGKGGFGGGKKGGSPYDYGGGGGGYDAYGGGGGGFGGNPYDQGNYGPVATPMYDQFQGQMQMPPPDMGGMGGYAPAAQDNAWGPPPM